MGHQSTSWGLEASVSGIGLPAGGGPCIASCRCPASPPEDVSAATNTDGGGDGAVKPQCLHVAPTSVGAEFYWDRIPGENQSETEFRAGVQYEGEAQVYAVTVLSFLGSWEGTARKSEFTLAPSAHNQQ